MKILSNRKTAGATLSFVIGVIVIMTVLGVGFFFMLRYLSGAKQVANATDAGVLNAGQQMLTVSLSSTQVQNLPILFQSLGVDLTTGKTLGLNSDGNGPATNALFDLIALNNMGTATIIIAENAAEQNTTAAIANANALIAQYTTAANQLTQQITTSTAQASAVDTMSGLNSVNMLGRTSTSLLADSSTSNGLDYNYVSVPSAATNVYFPQNSYAQNDPSFSSLITQTKSGTKSSSGAYLTKGYTPIQVGTTAQGISNIFLVPIANQTHLLNTGIAKQYTGVPGNYAPPNTITGKGQALTSIGQSGSSSGNNGNGNGNGNGHGNGNGNGNGNGGPGLGNTSNNMAVTAIASAVVGASAQFAASLPTGYIRIHNYPDAILANQTPAAGDNNSNLASTIYKLSSLECVLNTEYWTGAGGAGGVNVANWHTTTGVVPAGQIYLTSCGDPYNSVFDTEDFEGTDGSTTPFVLSTTTSSPTAVPYTGTYSGSGEIQAWISYCNTSGSDGFGHDPDWQPNSPTASHRLPYYSPSKNLRAGYGYEQGAQLSDLIHLGGGSILNCNTFSPGMGSAVALGDPAYMNLTIFNTNYYGNWDYTSERDSITYDTGSNFSIGGLTNLEWIKANVMQAWITTWAPVAANNNSGNPQTGVTDVFTSYTPPVPVWPSGVHVYDRTGATGFASPSNTNGLTAFGTAATAYDLINKQIYGTTAADYGQNVCANISDTTSSASPWSDITTPLGALLQRCQEIFPAVQASDLATLLQQGTLDLNATLYIYLPIGGSQLIISSTPPPWATTQSMPDGTALPSCSNSLWSGVIGNAVDGFIQVGTDTPNLAGDCDLHDAPWDVTSGTLSTQDNYS